MSVRAASRRLFDSVRGAARIGRPHAGTLFSLIGINVFVAGLSFLTSMVIANTLGSKTFGDFAFAIAIGTYGQIFIQYGLEKSLVRELVHHPGRFGEILKASLWLRGAIALVYVVLLVLIVGTMVRRHEAGWGMIWVPLAMVLAAFQLFGAYDALNSMKRHSVYLMVEKCLYLALVWFVMLVPVVPLSVGILGILMMASALVGMYLQYSWAGPRIEFRPVEGTRRSVVLLMRSNALVWLAVLSGLSIEYFSQIILKWYIGSAELGVYNVAWRTVQFAVLFLAQAGRIGAEATARHTRPEVPAGAQLKFLVKYVSLMGAMGFLVGWPFLFFPRQIIMLFRPEYAGAAEILRALSFYAFLYGPYLALLQFVVSSRMDRAYFILITVVGIASCGLSRLLIPAMQGRGAAISVIASLGVALVLFAAVVGHRLKNMKPAQAAGGLLD
jgi:O-antigen/teichoic acid export membrane protein